MGLLFFMFHCFEYNIFFFSFPDLALMIFMLFLILKRRRILLNIEPATFYLFSFLFALFISTFYNINQEYFSVTRFGMAYAKITLYFFMFLLLVPWFRQKFTFFIGSIHWSLCLIIFLGLYQFFAHYFFPFLPYSLSPVLLATRSGYEAMTSYGGFFRLKSIYAEPSHFGIYINILYFILIISVRPIKKYIHFLVLLSTGLTFSLSALALYVSNVLVQAASIRNLSEWVKRAGLMLCVFSILFTNEFILIRIGNIVNKQEGSGVIRLWGSWEIAEKAPLWSGVSLGNISEFGDSISKKFNFTYASRTKAVFNIFAAVFLVAGLPSLLLYCMFIFALAKGDLRVVFFLTILGFSWGKFNTFPLWFLFSSISACLSNKSDNV